MTLRSRIIALILAWVAISACCCSCDYVRKFAGRPTSDDLAVLRLMRQTEIERQKAEEDSLEQLRQLALKMEKDSIDAVRVLADSGVAVLAPSDFGVSELEVLDHRYYIAVGSYKQKYNVNALMKKIDAEKYSPVSVHFKSGLEVVLISPTNRIAGIPDALEQALKEDFCPKDAWILDTGERQEKE